jgi:hypothetical protein
MHWSLDDVRIIGDIVVGSMMASFLRLIVAKAFLEPLAMWTGHAAYRWADQASGDRLPDWVPRK